MAKKQVKPRRHNRKPLPQLDDKGVLERRDKAVLAFDRAFRASLPQHPATGQNAMAHGHYAQVEGDAFHEKDYPVADGRYRVQGSDWIHAFEGGGYVESERAEPPDFGGPKVIAVAPAAG